MQRRVISLIVAATLFFVTSEGRAEASAPWGSDKALHLGLSLALTVAGWGVSTELFQSPAARLAFAGGLALLAGGAKELVDLAGAGEAEWLDLAMDLLGVATGILFALVFDRLLRRRAHARTQGFVRRASGALGHVGAA